MHLNVDVLTLLRCTVFIDNTPFYMFVCVHGIALVLAGPCIELLHTGGILCSS